MPNPYLDYLANPSFQGVSRLFVSNFFNQLVNNNLRTYDNIHKIVTGQGDDYPSSCLLDYKQFNNFCEMIVIDLNKQQVLDADPKAIEQINFKFYLNKEIQQCFLLMKKWQKSF